MGFETAKSALGETVINQALNYLARDPERNLVKLMSLGEFVAIDPQHKEYARKWREMFADEDNNWRKMIVKLIREVSPQVREKIMVNMFVNAGILSSPRRKQAEKEHGVHIPWTILIDPTGKCNLRCKGCWAGDYDPTKEMDFSTLDRILTEAEELGIRFFVISGGEPLCRAEDLMKLAEKHNESVFHVFTNGTLITPEMAKSFSELGNMTFAISIEGLEKETDKRRGKGVFQKVMAAMDNLRDAGVIFGFSATYTRCNTDVLRSDNFIDLMIDKGCRLGWLFTYVPVGGDLDLEYMVTPEQRASMYRTVQKWRKEKPIFVADFWNDGEAVGGCIAGARSYFHINSAGDVEPCAFVHYSNVNINDCSLLEALKSPIFKAFQANQPFNSNMLRPCPLLDNPERLEKMVIETGARSTEINNVSVTDLRKILDAHSKAWGDVSDAIWEETRSTAEFSANEH